MQHQICHMHPHNGTVNHYRYEYVICNMKFVTCAALNFPYFSLFSLFLDPLPTMEEGHKPIPSDVFEVADRHSVVGHKNWPA